MKRSALVAVIVLAVVAGLAWQRTRPAGRTSITLLITGGTVVTMDAAGSIIPDGAVAIDGDAIVAVGAAADLDARYNTRSRHDHFDNCT